jgi:hypothetical protein
MRLTLSAQFVSPRRTHVAYCSCRVHLCFWRRVAGYAPSHRLARAAPESRYQRRGEVEHRLIATLAALVLGLLIASAQSSFQAQSSQIKQITASVILLDNILARSGPEGRPVRILLRSAVETLVKRIWDGHETAVTTGNTPFEASTQSNLFFDKLLELSPQNDGQRQMQARAVQIGIDLAQTRILFEQSGSTISKPFLAVLVFWLTIIFVSFGLFARPNLTIVAALFVCSLSASAAIFLIFALSHPFSGLMAIPSAPMSNALAPLGA